MTENTSAVVGGAWLAVVAGVVGNTVASLAGDSMPVHLGFGALTAVGVLTLVVNWLHRR